MWSQWLSGSTLPALEQSAAFAERRQVLLAGNIANLDVPGYKTRDLSTTEFQTRLHDAVTARRNPSPGHITASPGEVAPMERVRDVSKQILFHDGNDVSLEEQVTEIAKNEAFHNMAIALLRSQFRNIEAAIRESVNV